MKFNLNNRLLIKFLLGSSTCLIGLYLLISACAAYFLSTPQRNFNSQAVQVFAVPPQDVQFKTDDGLIIQSWFIPASSSNKAIILVHGMNSSRTAEFGGHFAEFGAALHRQNFTVLMIDLRGHGQSSNAHFSFGIHERKDIIAAVSWLKSQGFKPRKIGVLGVSMGAASSIGATADEPHIGALAIDSGYAEVYPIIKKQWHSTSGLPNLFLPSTLIFTKFLVGSDITLSKPILEMNKITPRPVLIIHSTFDPFTSINNAYQLHKAIPSSQLWTTSAREHAGSYNENSKLYIKKITKFFNKNL